MTITDLKLWNGIELNNNRETRGIMNLAQTRMMKKLKRTWWKLQKDEAQCVLSKQDKNMFLNGFESGFEAAVDYLSTTPMCNWCEYPAFNCHCNDEDGF